jgi:hypothetical protein
MAEHSVIGVYKTLADIEHAVRVLGDEGFPIQKVSIVGQHLQDERRVHGYFTAYDAAKTSAATGAWVGGFFGLLAGAAFLWLPGVGPLVVVGSLAAVLLGGVEGAVAGAAVTGLLGWLFSLGISREKILKYEEAVKAGKFLLIAHGSEEEVEWAREILTRTATEQVDRHAPHSAQPVGAES